MTTLSNIDATRERAYELRQCELGIVEIMIAAKQSWTFGESREIGPEARQELELLASRLVNRMAVGTHERGILAARRALDMLTDECMGNALIDMDAPRDARTFAEPALRRMRNGITSFGRGAEAVMAAYNGTLDGVKR